MGEKDRALADLTRLLAVDPAATDGYRRRGRTRFDRGDFSGAAQDFRVYFQRFPEDPYGLVWMYISTARAGGDVDRALHDLRQVASAEDTWSGMLIRMFRGELPPSSLLESASSVTDDRIRRQRLREAHLHVAEFYLIHGKPYEARISLEEIVATDRSQSAEFATARAELERLRN